MLFSPLLVQVRMQLYLKAVMQQCFSPLVYAALSPLHLHSGQTDQVSSFSVHNNSTIVTIVHAT